MTIDELIERLTNFRERHGGNCLVLLEDTAYDTVYVSVITRSDEEEHFIIQF